MGFLTGKTAIITGAGRAVLSDGRCGSIGYGIATAYAKEGANLVITGRNVKKLEDAKEELERLYGIKVLIVQADVNAGADNEAVVNNVIKQTIDTFGRIDVLINNAQASASGVTLHDHTTEQFDLAVYSGMYAAFYYMKACYPYLAESKGTVVNFASGAGLFGNFGQCAYAAAKEGIRGLSRVAATEWAKDGIGVFVVCPLAWTAQLEQFDLAVYSGMYAAFYYMKACYPYLAESKGTVVNFASGAGLFGNFGQCAYAAAKEGIRGLSRVAATEWAKDGIGVFVVCPLAWTAQLEQFEKAYPDAFKANVKMPPAGHFGDSELEIGRVCVQVANPDFKYMTGETLTLEGGMGLRP